MDNDEDVQELLKRPLAKAFGLADWTYDRELLTSIAESIHELHATVVAVASGEDRQSVDPFPRPVTAVERLATRQTTAVRENAIAALLPNGVQEVDPAEAEAAIAFYRDKAAQSRPQGDRLHSAP